MEIVASEEIEICKREIYDVIACVCWHLGKHIQYISVIYTDTNVNQGQPLPPPPPPSPSPPPSPQSVPSSLLQYYFNWYSDSGSEIIMEYSRIVLNNTEPFLAFHGSLHDFNFANAGILYRVQVSTPQLRLLEKLTLKAHLSEK
uniref:Uncharacterized protein n=1 Tax=Glossina palpalis gambiensis TaxID=67801 RepID=A0A1B0BPH3_9MUSC